MSFPDTMNFYEKYIERFSSVQRISESKAREMISRNLPATQDVVVNNVCHMPLCSCCISRKAKIEEKGLLPEKYSVRSIANVIDFLSSFPFKSIGLSGEPSLLPAKELDTLIGIVRAKNFNVHLYTNGVAFRGVDKFHSFCKMLSPNDQIMMPLDSLCDEAIAKVRSSVHVGQIERLTECIHVLSQRGIKARVSTILTSSSKDEIQAMLSKISSLNQISEWFLFRYYLAPGCVNQNPELPVSDADYRHIRAYLGRHRGKGHLKIRFVDASKLVKRRKLIAVYGDGSFGSIFTDRKFTQNIFGQPYEYVNSLLFGESKRRVQELQRQ